MFKIGEKVRVKEHLNDEMYIDDVRELAGKIVTIKDTNELGDYVIEEDNGKYNWFNSELEKIEESDSMFKVGDRVKIGDLDFNDNIYVESMKSTIGEIGKVRDVLNKAISVRFEDGSWYYRAKDLELIESRADFKIGDRVEIVTMDGGETESSIFDIGHIGTITEIGGYYGLKDTVVRLDNRPIGWVNIEDIELIEEVSHKFKIGDKVRILDIDLEDNFYTDSMIDTLGEIGTIIDIRDNDVEVQFEDVSWYYMFDDIEVLDFVPKYKVGDKVRILSDDSSVYYSKGDITEIIDVDYDDRFLTYELKKAWVEEDDIELVVEDETEFKVGDRVEIVNNSFAEDYNVGELATILEYDDYDDTYLVEIESNGYTDWTNAKDLELVEDLEFELGDKVKVVSKDNRPTNTSCWNRNHIGTITFVDKFSDNIVQLDDENKGWVHTDDLVHVDSTFDEVSEELGFKFMTLEEIEEELGYNIVIVSKK